MSLTNLDVTALFPFPGELAVRPHDSVSSPVATDAASSPSGELKQTETSTQPVEPSKETMAEYVKQLNSELHNFGIEFEFNETDNRLITRVIDSATGELIRQIPSEEVLRMSRSLSETRGLLLQTTA